MYVLINKLTAMIFARRRKEFSTNIEISVRHHRFQIFLRVNDIRIRILIEFAELKLIELYTTFRKECYDS